MSVELTQARIRQLASLSEAQDHERFEVTWTSVLIVPFCILLGMFLVTFIALPGGKVGAWFVTLIEFCCMLTL